MTRFEIKEPKFFNDVFSLITEISNEGFMVIGEEGIHSYGIGPSRIILYNLEIGKVPKDGELFGFNSQDFQKVLSRLKAATEMTLEYDKKRRKVKLVAKVGDTKKTFIISTIDPEVENIPLKALAKLPYSVILQINGTEMLTLVNDCEIFSEFIEFTFKEKTVEVGASAIGGEVKIEKEAKIVYLEEKNVEAKYAIKFLKMLFGNIGARSCNILFGVSQEHGILPLFCNLEFSEEHKLSVWIGPRVGI